MDQVRHYLRVRHYARKTEKIYVAWIKRDIYYHGKHHAKDLGGKRDRSLFNPLGGESQCGGLHAESTIARSASIVAVVTGCIAPGLKATYRAFNELIFPNKNILRREIKEPINAFRAKRPALVPTVLTTDETGRLLSAMQGTQQLMAKLIYGSTPNRESNSCGPTG